MLGSVRENRGRHGPGTPRRAEHLARNKGGDNTGMWAMLESLGKIRVHVKSSCITVPGASVPEGE